MSPRPLHLSVNIDHVATLRQARRAPYPDPVEAAAIAERAGAHGITVHLRVDRRHIQDHDVSRLRPRVAGKLNLEISTADEMLDLAVETRPDQVTLVPERPEEITTEGGLDVVGRGDDIRRAAERLAEHGLAVSLFLDPDLRQIDALLALDGQHASAETRTIPGFEINTDAYTKAALGDDPDTARHELEKVQRTAAHGTDAGLRVYAGHGLTTANVGPIAAVPAIEELNIGHWIVSRAALVGMERSVHEMLDAMREGRRRSP